MTKIILSGCNGRMGRQISEICKASTEYKIVAGVDAITEENYDYHVYSDIDGIEIYDAVIIDFSHHTFTKTVLEFAKKHKIPVVLCTTGHSDEEKKEIEGYSKSVAIFKSANMSLGINVLIELANKAATILQNDFDIEIIEKHHNQKIDAPSGTALLIADSMKEHLDYNPEYVYSRHENTSKRDKNEIGIHSIRGGTIVGEHEVIFAGENEVISLKHEAESRGVFAKGALTASKFMVGKKPGLYDMKKMLSSIL